MSKLSTSELAGAVCRGCGRKLQGHPYHLGGPAYHPETGERCRINHYGGFVCSPLCDYNSSLWLEQSMPGHDGNQKTIGCFAQKSYDRNWDR